MPTTASSNATLRQHITTEHQHPPLHTQSDQQLAHLGLAACRPCHKLFLLKAHQQGSPTLKSHNTRQHSSHSPTAPRSNTNLQLIQDSLRHAQAQPWQEALKWLHDLQPTPPLYRTNLWRRLTQETKTAYFATLHHVYNWVAKASQPLPPAATRQAWLSSSLPFWNLLLITDMLLLHPKPKGCHLSASSLVKQRLREFKQGQLQALYLSAHASTRPPTRATTAAAAAQLAADEDNYHTAYARIVSALPVASITPEVQALCQKLYPKPTSYQAKHPKATRQSATQPPVPMDLPTLQQTLRHLKRGTAAGPFADLPETLRAFALYQPRNSPIQPYLQPFSEVLQLILANRIPPQAGPYFAANYFMALHKDPDDPTKLRPIGMGGALRRVAGKYAMEILKSRLASYLLPFGQFAIAIRGGLQFMVDSIRTQIHRYLPTTANPHLASRVLLLLDIRNMFNEVSRAAVRDFLFDSPEFSCLLPFYDLCYGDPNRCYYFSSTGSLDFFLQQEGHAQGCPMGPTMSVFCLCLLLSKLSALLQDKASARAHQGHLGDDGLGTLALFLEYIDDTTVSLAPADVVPFLAAFQAWGKPLGIQLNFSKTKLLTTTLGAPSLDPHVVAALAYIRAHAAPGTSPEITTGVRFLGQPVGSSDFAASYLAKAAAKYSDNLTKLWHSDTTLHTKCLLFNSCALPSVQHLLTSDVHYNLATSTPTPHLITHWTSPFQQAIQQATSSFLSLLGSAPFLPPLAHLLLHHPVSAGGLGTRDNSASSIPAYIITTARNLRYATQGIPIDGNITATLPQPLARTLASWERPGSTVPLFCQFRALLPSFLTLYQALPQYSSDPAPTPAEFVAQAPLQHLSTALYHQHCKSTLDLFLAAAPAPTRSLFPSILSPFTSLALRAYNRRFPHNRLQDDVFQLLFQRKLRLPILPSSATQHPCTHCHKALDPFGDHFFCCRTYSKKGFSDGIRDTLFHVASHLAPLAGFTYSKHGVTCETTSLLDTQGFPNQRPADVGIALQPNAVKPPTTPPSTFLAIDVTVTSFLPSPSAQPAPQTPPLLKAHHSATRSKLTAKSLVPPADYFTALLQAGIILLPFTVDPFLGLGPFAHAFLFGSSDSPFPKPPPPWVQRLPPHSQPLYSALLSAPKAMLLQASPTASAPSSTVAPYSPSRWAHQLMALNLSTQLALHVLRARTRLLKDSFPSGTSPASVLTDSYAPSAPATILDPFPLFLQAGVT